VNKNVELEELIFSILVNTLKDDVKKYNEGIPRISNLAKWLPREGSHFDKRLNFVNRFVLKFFPTIFVGEISAAALDHAKKKYRLILTDINAKLETLEALISAEKQINYNNLGTTQINKYFYKFYDEDFSGFVLFLKAKYMNMGVRILDPIRENKIKHEEERTICNHVWHERKHMYYTEMNKPFGLDLSGDLLVDITQDMYEDGIIANMFCLILWFMENQKNVYLGNEKIPSQESRNIFDRIQMIEQCIQPSVSIKIPTDGVHKILYMISSRDNEFESFGSYDKIIVHNSNGTQKRTFEKSLIAKLLCR